jgi:hypothetical protein
VGRIHRKQTRERIRAGIRTTRPAQSQGRPTESAMKTRFAPHSRVAGTRLRAPGPLRTVRASYPGTRLKQAARASRVEAVVVPVSCAGGLAARVGRMRARGGSGHHGGGRPARRGVHPPAGHSRARPHHRADVRVRVRQRPGTRPRPRHPRPQTMRSASVGDIRAARRAGSRPAIVPMAMAAPMPPAQASAGITMVQCFAWA